MRYTARLHRAVHAPTFSARRIPRKKGHPSFRIRLLRKVLEKWDVPFFLPFFPERWGIEASFRDIKDLRFGMGMTDLRIGKPERRDRLLLVSAIALALLTILGATGEALGYDRMLKANTVKRRTHSLFRQGCMLYDWLPRMPEKYFEPLVRAFAENLMQQPGLAVVFSLPRK